ncbi:MAG: class I SAM-dependent methyltransferase [bacterium]
MPDDVLQKIKRLDPIYAARFVGPVYASRLNRLVKWTRPKGKKVLDAGCGFGLLMHMLRHSGAQYPVTGLNINQRQLDAARKSIEEPGAQAFSWINADILNMPFASENFDIVYATDVLEHIKELPVALAEISRVLKPGGILAASLPTEGGLYNLGRNIFGDGHKPRDHYRSAAEIETEILEKFSVEKRGYAPGFWLPIYRLITAEKR